MQAHLYSGLTLAYIGDAIYEVKIRESLINMGLTKIDDLHKKAVCFTKGEFQAKLIRHLVLENVLSEEELSIYKRGRNSSVKLTRKNIKLSDYLDATGLESLVGFLYLNKQDDRINEIINIALQIS